MPNMKCLVHERSTHKQSQSTSGTVGVKDGRESDRKPVSTFHRNKARSTTDSRSGRRWQNYSSRHFHPRFRCTTIILLGWQRGAPPRREGYPLKSSQGRVGSFSKGFGGVCRYKSGRLGPPHLPVSCCVSYAEHFQNCTNPHTLCTFLSFRETDRPLGIYYRQTDLLLLGTGLTT